MDKLRISTGQIDAAGSKLLRSAEMIDEIQRKAKGISSRISGCTHPASAVAALSSICATLVNESGHINWYGTVAREAAVAFPETEQGILQRSNTVGDTVLTGTDAAWLNANAGAAIALTSIGSTVIVSEVSALCGNTNLITGTAEGAIVQSGWRLADFFKGSKSASEVLDILFGTSKASALTSDLKEITDSSTVRVVSYAKDVYKLSCALQSSDQAALQELGEKYTKETVKKVVGCCSDGVGGFTLNAYINLGWNLVENMLEVDQFDNFGSYLYNCTGGVIFETGSEMAYSIVDKIGGVFGYDLDGTYEALVGEGGAEGFMKATNELGDTLFGDYYSSGKYSDNNILNAAGGTIHLIGESVAWWAKAIADVF